VHNPATFPADHPFYVSESSPLPEYAAGREPSEWTDAEIAAIRRVLFRLTALRILNPTDAEDLVQDTLLTMIAKHPGFELEKGLLVWSMGILRKKVGNYYRKTRRFAYLGDQDSIDQNLTRELSVHTSPEAKVFHEELQGLIKETLAQLPSDQRQPIELLIAGLDSGEIVKKLYPERYQNVMNRIHRGRKKLAKELAKYGYGPNARTAMRRMKRCQRK
jgi:RNA polymerase sigma factor (sigma-70 family)